MTQTATSSTVGSRVSRIAIWALVAVTFFLGVVHRAGIFFIADRDDERLLFTCYTPSTL